MTLSFRGSARWFVLLSSASLCAIAAPALAEENDDAKREIVVTGDVLYNDQVNALKTPTKIIDVPQSLSIATEEDIAKRGFTSIGQIVNYTPGVSTSMGEGHRDSVVFRGVRSTADFFIDGVRDDVQYYRGLYNLEQVEILRGPNALLFGRGGTGGIVNRVTKKAKFEDTSASGQLAVDTFGGFSVFSDVNLSSSDSAAFRINAAYENLNNHRDFFDGERIGINPTARFALGDDTILDLSYEYADHERFIDRGIPTGADGRPVAELKDIVFGNQTENFMTLEAHLLRGKIEHRFSDSWKGILSGFYGDYDKVYSNFYTANYDPVTNIAELDGYIDTTKRDNLVLSGSLVGEFDTGGLKHTLLIGGEYIGTSSDQNRFNPVFDTSLADIAAGGAADALNNPFGPRSDRANFLASRPLTFSGNTGVLADGRSTVFAFSELNDLTQVDLDVFSLYIQDEIKLTSWLNVVLGGRYDSFDIRVNNVPASEIRTRKDEEFSPRAGIIVKPQDNVSIYASYSESFLPRSGEQFANINGSNNVLDPDRFENLEAGLKWDFMRGLGLTAAIFELRQSQPQVDDNDASRFVVVHSKIQGFELQLTGEILPDWTVSAGYSFLDGEQVNQAGATGLRPRELPENMFSLWNQLKVSDRLGIGLGLTHQDESFIDNANTATLPAYTRVDAAAYFDVTPSLRLQINVENLTNADYYPNAHSTHQVSVGAPINARFALSAKL